MTKKQELKPMSKPLLEAIESIEKEFGKGAVMRLDGSVQRVPVIPTGLPSLDVALGCGGWPRGRVVEIYGAESGGKTTLTLHAIAEAQRRGGACAFVDAEHALDTNYAQALGVRTEDLLVSQPSCGEEALEITERLVRSGSLALLVVDSVAALTPKAEIDGDFGDAQMGAHARLMSQAMRKLTAVVSRTNTTVIFINQTRQKIGVVYGSPVTTTGGNALKFYASVRVEVARIGQLKDGEDVVGNRTRAKVVKNKMAPPFREVEFDLVYGRGASRELDLLDVCQEAVSSGSPPPIERSGAWFAYRGEKIGQGRGKAAVWLREHPDSVLELEEWFMLARGVERTTEVI